MSELKNIPKLRFSEFSGEWEGKKLGDLATFFSGGTPTSTNKNYYLGEIPFIGSGKISDSSVEQFITQEALEKSSAKIVEVGDLLYALYGATSGEVAISKIKGAINQAVLCIRSNQDKYFLYLWLYLNKTPILTRFLQGGQGNLSANIIKKLKINLPTIEEQKKIARFLSSVNFKIEELTKKEQLLQEYKKGIMQKIFNQEIQFKDDNGKEFPKWKNKRLNELLEYEQPTKYIVSSTEYKNNYTTPVLTAGKTFILGYTNELNGIYNQSPVIIFDDFTTANHYVDFDFKVKSSAMKILKGKNKEINLKFIYEVMQTLHFPIGEHKRYWISEYSYLKLELPCLEEQTKIANFLSSIDKKIDFVLQQLNQTKEFKKALLQQMFV